LKLGKAKGTISTMLKFCNAYNVTPNDLLYDFIKDSKSNIEMQQFDANIQKLNNRDKKVVFSLIEVLIENS